MSYRLLSCVTPPQWSHTSGCYTVLFSACGEKVGDETEPVNLLSDGEEAGSRANFHRRMVFGLRAEGGGATIFLLLLLCHVSFPSTVSSPLSPPPPTLDWGGGGGC